jgi:peptidylprolyl isomerase
LGKKRLQNVQQHQTGFVEKRMWIFILIGVILTASVVAYFVVGRPGSGGSGNQNTSNTNNPSSTTKPPVNESTSVKIRLATSMGNITIALFDDMPLTAGNFKNLTEHSIYDGTIFHRVVANFVVQGGDATPKGITVPTIKDELPNKHSNVRGYVAMAKTDAPNSATSQFYINLKDNSASLDSNYSVFGKVTEGMSVVDAIGSVATDTTNSSSPTYERPLQDITLISAQIIS